MRRYTQLVFNLASYSRLLMDEFLRQGGRAARVREAFADEPLYGATGSFEGITVEGWLGAPHRARAVRLLARTRDAQWQPLLRRYLGAQLSQCLFPFSGLGSTLTERITIIAVRFATLKLALASLEEASLQNIIDTVQPFSRFMDHLADPTLSLLMYEQTGWTRETRLRGLLGI